MNDLKQTLQTSVKQALEHMGVTNPDATDLDIPIQDVPGDKPGDYGTPVAFTLAKMLRKNPAAIAREIVSNLQLPAGIAKAEAIGPYINFFVDTGAFVKSVIERDATPSKQHKKVIVEHTSINPNKEAHVGHLRNICLGDAMGHILKAAGYDVELQNYIDDTGRQAAESLFAVDYFNANYDGSQKYDHWLGELYVKLQRAKEIDGENIEAGVREVMHRLERGELRDKVAEIVRSLLQTSYALGVEYDLLVWESDVVQSGFLAQGLAILKNSEYVSQPTKGKYAGALIMDVSKFIPGLEEPNIVLLRSDGNAMYVAKDIGYHYWKTGMFEGLKFERFDTQPSGRVLYTSSPKGDLHLDNRTFAHADDIINVIDARQSHPQQIVNAALKMSDDPKEHNHHHLAYEVVTLEGQAMSGRKGITLSIDETIEEAMKRVRAIMLEKNPNIANLDDVARQVGIGALRLAMLKSEAKRIIDFRWEQALSLQGDSAPYVQYAHARACKILRDAALANLSVSNADFSKLGLLESKLAQAVARFPDVIQSAAKDYAPHIVTQYALDLAAAWNNYYNHKDANGKPDTKILDAEQGLREARLAVVQKVRDTLAASLALLGIEAPQEM
ncbi:MAG: arginine--tRNA ligase [Trueperaceae bacterium]